MSKIIILGAGISGLGAGYSFRKNGCDPILLEKNPTYGGLCDNFEIKGFYFDHFVHFSFTNDGEVKRLFQLSAPNIIRHTPNPYNIYNKKWIKHPAQNNLYPLSSYEKQQIITDFRKRPIVSDINQIQNYEEWLRAQYGDYFAEHFPMIYTQKYWMCQARELETKWIGNRLYQPSIEEVIRGCETADTPVTYYAQEMCYPQKGGYKAFLRVLTEGLDIKYNSEIVEISPIGRSVRTQKGDVYYYDRLISSLPLPEILSMLKDLPDDVISAGEQLRYTSGYLISIALKTKNIPPYLWWYVYDEDILASRVYSPSLKSPYNVPEGCSSLQLEVYVKQDAYTYEELFNKTVTRLVELNIIEEMDILFVDIRFEKYANVVFDHNIYNSRKVIRDYLFSIGIETIGRFGEWDYFWSDQSLKSGMDIA
ncbi:NAD(P)-binding protein [Bacteroides sp.]|uniref:protoporphyrinogen/coproporphyrinogen oxidase n=1 Tax=Bacteroides sp. TaxID=29523 RepID=UPI0026273C38|nr:NAD(P)-binding protein [Bacteroides sp.]MDD3037283.1 FAD-dependent oxidoreductase [Bacteroides sp.]